MWEGHVTADVAGDKLNGKNDTTSHHPRYDTKNNVNIYRCVRWLVWIFCQLRLWPRDIHTVDYTVLPDMQMAGDRNCLIVQLVLGSVSNTEPRLMKDW